MESGRKDQAQAQPDDHPDPPLQIDKQTTQDNQGRTMSGQHDGLKQMPGVGQKNQAGRTKGKLWPLLRILVFVLIAPAPIWVPKQGISIGKTAFGKVKL